MTWNLVSQSFRLLRSDKKLLVFPVLSAIGAAALALPFLLVLFGILGGAETFGLLGLFIGPALMTVLVVLWTDLVQ